jgi:hypothetical protein
MDETDSAYRCQVSDSRSRWLRPFGVSE